MRFDKGLETRLRRLERGETFLRGGSRVSPSGANARVLGSSLTNGRVDPTSGNVIVRGTPTGTLFPMFTGTAGANSITWNWGGALRRVDGTAQAVPASSLTINGLAAATKYYFYPFFATRGCGIGWVAGNTGSPAFAHTAPTDAAAQAQNMYDREALSYGAISATTGTGAITGGGSTGGTGNPGGCPRSYMVVESKLRGIVKCETLKPGEFISSPDGSGWTQVVSMKMTPCEAFVLIRTDAGDEIEISPEAQQPMFDDDNVVATLLTLASRVKVKHPGGGSGYISKLNWVEAVDGVRVVLGCEPEHRFWCGRHEPNICAHNLKNDVP